MQATCEQPGHDDEDGHEYAECKCNSRSLICHVLRYLRFLRLFLVAISASSQLRYVRFLSPESIESFISRSHFCIQPVEVLEALESLAPSSVPQAPAEPWISAKLFPAPESAWLKSASWPSRLSWCSTRKQWRDAPPGDGRLLNGDSLL